jgi:glycosyltransferase involved in cell wall biosynthesis
VNILLLSSRFPWPAHTGDRLRATIWLAALEDDARVALVSPAGRVPPNAPRFRFHPATRSLRRGAAGALRVLRGTPVHALLAAPFDWAEAIERARDDLGGFDAAIVLLSRLDPWVRPFLPNGLRVLDAIDSLRRSMAERSRHTTPPMRWFCRAESRRVARAEEEAARVYDRVIVVSAEESAELRATAIPNGVIIAPLADAPRLFDFGFWGRLAYFANADAATWLLDEIWPAIRAQRPQATLVIAGADAPARIRAAHGRDGIVVQSPVDDIAALARQIRVALFPVRYGTGQSNKVLEAAEGGCAVVATARALRGLEPLARHAFVADDAAGLARSAIAAIADEPRRAAAAGALRGVVETSYRRQETLERLAAIVHRREAAA